MLKSFEFYYDSIKQKFNSELDIETFNGITHIIRCLKKEKNLISIDDYLNVNCKNCKNCWCCVKCYRCKDCENCWYCEDCENSITLSC